MSNLTILCVDDELNVLLALRTQLQRCFPACQVEIAECADEALELVDLLRSRGTEVPLVIADQIMPGMKGDEFLIELHARHPEILTVMLAGQARAEDVGNIVNRGKLYRFMTKPWNEIDLNLTVTEALRCYQQERLAQKVGLESNPNLKTIFDRQQIDLDLPKIPERDRLLSDISPVGIFWNDARGQCTYANIKTLEITGLTLEENLGDGWGKNLHPDDLDWMYAAWNSFVEQAKFDLAAKYVVEPRYLHPDGSLRWIQAQAVAERNVDGEIVGFIGSLIDNTDRKQAEIDLHASESIAEMRTRQLYTLLNNIPYIAWLKDRDGRFLAVNEPFAQACGYDSAQLVGLTDLDIWTPELAEAYRNDDFEVMSSGKQKRVEEKLITADGDTQWIETIKTPVISDRNEPMGTAGIAIDITDRKQAEIALHESELRFRGIFDQMYQFVGLLSPDGKPLEINQRALDFTGLNQAEFLSYDFWELPAWHKPQVVEFVRDAVRRAAHGEFVRGEVEALGVENIAISIDFSLRPIFDDDGKVILLIAEGRDISDRKQAEIALQASESKQSALISALPDLIMRVNREGVYLDFFATKAFKVIGQTGDFVGTRVDESLSPKLAEMRMKAIDAALNTKEMQIYEQEILVDGVLQTEECRVVFLSEDEVIIVGRDISDRKRQELTLQSLMEGTASVTGKDFFLCLVEKITVALDVSHVLIAKQVGESLETLAIYYDSQIQPNIMYEIAHTPCSQSIQEGRYYCPRDVQACFPLDEALVQIGVESYLGLALKNALGETIGVLCILNRKPIANPERAELLLRIFAARAASELERLQVLESLVRFV